METQPVAAELASSGQQEVDKRTTRPVKDETSPGLDVCHRSAGCAGPQGAAGGRVLGPDLDLLAF